MRAAGCVVIAAVATIAPLAGCGGGGGSPAADGAAGGDGPAVSDGPGVDAVGRPDARPVTPARLALAAVSSLNTIQVHADTGTGFRSVYSHVDGNGGATGITWTDYDGDGRDDVVSSYTMTATTDLLVIHNDGASGLSTVGEIGAGLHGNVRGFDADGDGDGDLYAGDFGDPDRMFVSDGSTLIESPWLEMVDASAWEYGIATGDVTGDGVPDILLAREIHGEAVKQGDPAGPMPLWSQYLPDDGFGNDAAVVDYDGDGALEISFAEATYDETAGAVSIYRWAGGQMNLVDSRVELGPVYKLDWADIEGDGDSDLAVCHGTHVLGVYRRTGANLDPEPGLSGPCYAVRWGDYDADGDPDLAVSDGGITVYRNDGGGTWTPAYHTDQLGSSIAWGRCGPVTSPCFAAAP